MSTREGEQNASSRDPRAVDVSATVAAREAATTDSLKPGRPRRPRYGAFISYSHLASQEVARGLQKWLQIYAKPWYRWRAVNVFRDETDLAAAPALWSKITRALDDSSHFILLASPRAAQSKWVKREVRHWLGDSKAHEAQEDALDAPMSGARPERAAALLIALTDGEIAWDENGRGTARGDFDWKATNALPRVLAGAFTEEPQWIDLRQIVRRDDLRNSLARSNAAFMHAVAQLSAPIRGVADFSQLVSEDFRQHKRAMRTAWAAVASLVLLMAAAVWQWREADYQRIQAEQQLRGKQVSQSRFLIDQARESLADHDAGTAMLLAIEALPAEIGAPDARPYLPEAEAVLFDAVAEERELRSLIPETPAIEPLTGSVVTVDEAWFSPDGTRVVTASGDKTARVWDVASGKEIVSQQGLEEGDPSVAFSPDGTRVASGAADHTVRVWDAASGRELAVLRGHQDAIIAVTFSPDGSRILSNSADDTARVWDAASGRSLAVLHGGTDVEGDNLRVDRVGAAVFSPDGARVVTVSDDGTGRIWDAATGRQIASLTGHEGGIAAVAFSPDGKRIVTGSSDATARVWDAASGDELARMRGHSHTVIGATFSPDGARVLTASYDKTARLWDAGSGEQLALLAGHTDYVYSALFSPDGTLIATASPDGTAGLWDAAGGYLITLLGGNSLGVNSAAFSSDGTRIVTASYDGSARVWAARSSEPLELLQLPSGKTYAAAISPDGTRIATASDDGKAIVWEMSSGRQLAVLDGRHGSLTSVAFSPDGTRIVTGSADNSASVWDVAAAREAVVIRGSGADFSIDGVAFSPDGSRVITASKDGTARIWDAASGQAKALVLEHENFVGSAAFSPDGKRVVTACWDGTARIWDAATGILLTTLFGEHGHEAAINSAAFSPDGTRVVTASDDETARIWDANTGEMLATLTGHADQLRSAAFSPDGTRVVTGSLDATARLWDAESGRALGVLRGHAGPVMSTMFSPDGTRVVTASADGTTRVWRVFPTAQALVDYARSILPRALTAGQRQQYYLDEAAE